MALGTPVAGAAAYSAASGTTVSPAYPAGILATDEVVLFVGQKPGTANGGTVTTPTGWTLRDSLTGAGGYGATLGADTGNTNLFVYTWDTPVAGQTGNLAVTIGGNNVTWAFMVRVPTGGGAVSVGSADGQRTTTPTSPMTVALTNGATATNFQAGDLALWAMCIPTDVTTPAQFSAHSVTATGATFATAVEINEPDSTTGNDIGGFSAYASVSSGSSTAAPSITVTVGGTLTNVRGPVVMLRLREAAPAPITGTFAASETGSDTFAATGDVHVKGALAATETGADTFAATGSVGSAAITGTLAATETGADTFAATGDVIVKGSLAATEAGADTFTATGKVIIRGSLAASETGADTFTSTGKVLVRGALAATEAGSDTLAASGKVIVKGSLAASETSADSFAATGKVIVRGALAATETGSDTFAATGDVIVQGAMAATETGADIFFGNGTSQITTAGTLAATETGNDTASATGKVLVSGALAASETGADAFASTGKVLVRGTLAASESGADAFAATGDVIVAGALAASEVGADTLAGTGKVLVRGTLGASETGNDTFAGSGGAVIVGTLAAVEQGTDSFSASGAVTFGPRTGTLAATEAADSFGGYVEPGYVEPGYVSGGVYGTVGATFAITGAQAMLLRKLCQLHGLFEPLVVAPTSRSAGDLVQSVNENAGTVTVTTTGGGTTFRGSPGLMIEELAALHGLTAPLVVSPTTRTAGPITQVFGQSGNTTTVTRQ